MRIVSLNTWKCDGPYRLRLAAMARGLQALQPDVLLLQEAFRSADRRYDTARVLADELGLQVQGHWQRRKSRLCEGDWMESESGMAVLSRRPLADCIAVTLPGHPEDPERVGQWLNLGSQARPVWWGHVHLTHLPEASAGSLRTQQLLAMLAHAAVAEAKEPLWLMGDFNTDMQTSGWETLDLGGRRLTDALAEAGLAPKGTHFDARGRWQDLDHLLVLRQPGHAGEATWRITRAAVVLDRPDSESGVLCSDHLGICADLVPPVSHLALAGQP
jgi:endonuclease/exonuclease/phosphatase family metal-dependent hydrolase